MARSQKICSCPRNLSHAGDSICTRMLLAPPIWIQRLLPAVLGGASGQTPMPGDLLRQIDAAGQISVDEFSLEKLKLKQLHAQASLRDLHLQLQDAQAQWAGGVLRGNLRAVFGPKPSYTLSLQGSGLNLAQLSLAGKVADRIS